MIFMRKVKLTYRINITNLVSNQASECSDQKKADSAVRSRSIGLKAFCESFYFCMLLYHKESLVTFLHSLCAPKPQLSIDSEKRALSCEKPVVPPMQIFHTEKKKKERNISNDSINLSHDNEKVFFSS